MRKKKERDGQGRGVAKDDTPQMADIETTRMASTSSLIVLLITTHRINEI